MTQLDEDDVVVREKSGNPHSEYFLGTPATPDQFILPTREAAVAQALVFARRQALSAWFAQGDIPLVLLGTFRIGDVECAKGDPDNAPGQSEAEDAATAGPRKREVTAKIT